MDGDEEEESYYDDDLYYDDSEDDPSVAHVYDAARPFVIELEYDDERERVYEPVFDLQEKDFPVGTRFFKPKFVLPSHVNATASSLLEVYLSDKLLDGWVKCTNDYARARLPPSKCKEITRREVLHFLGAIAYMGLVVLPSKDDYFVKYDRLNHGVGCSPTDADGLPSILPHHPSIRIRWSMFRYMWANFHTSFQPQEEMNDDEDDVDVDDDDDDSAYSEYSYTKERGYYDGVSSDEEVVDEVMQGRIRRDVPEVGQLWYKPIEGFIDHVNETSKKLCHHPGWTLSIDEMMKLFKGRSCETHRMPKKPVKKGYKFFAICDSTTAFAVFHFFPSGRNDKAKTLANVKRLLDTIPRTNQLQYVVAMDNFFTTSDVIKATRERGMGVVGTARHRINWPPHEMKRIGVGNDEQAQEDNRFNTLHLLNDKSNYLIARWVDNAGVNMVSTVHTGYEKVVRFRKKPRPNDFNRRHVDIVWGSQAVTQIEIPSIIDDYNHWMGGVDKADQLIASYRHKLQCRRTWMPIFFHCLDVIRVNSYIIAKTRDSSLTHKAFLINWISALNQRAEFEAYKATRSALTNFYSPPGKTKNPLAKRQRVVSKNPQLPLYRLAGKRSDHVAIISNSQNLCRYCCYVRACAKMEGKPEPVVRKPMRKCLKCNDHLCATHFDIYHEKTPDEVHATNVTAI